MQHLFLSARDVARCFACAIEAAGIDYAVVYAVGPAGVDTFDMEPARRTIGFEPHDHWPSGLDFEWPVPSGS